MEVPLAGRGMSSWRGAEDDRGICVGVRGARCQGGDGVEVTEDAAGNAESDANGNAAVMRRSRKKPRERPFARGQPGEAEEAAARDLLEDAERDLSEGAVIEEGASGLTERAERIGGSTWETARRAALPQRCSRWRVPHRPGRAVAARLDRLLVRELLVPAARAQEKVNLRVKRASFSAVIMTLGLSNSSRHASLFDRT